LNTFFLEDRYCKIRTNVKTLGAPDAILFSDGDTLPSGALSSNTFFGHTMTHSPQDLHNLVSTNTEKFAKKSHLLIRHGTVANAIMVIFSHLI